MGIRQRLPPRTGARRAVSSTTLRKLSSGLRAKLHRVPLPRVGRVASVCNARRRRRIQEAASAGAGDLSVSVGGTSSRNFVFAARSIHFHGGLAPVIALTLVLLALVTAFSAYRLNAAQSSRPAIPAGPTTLGHGQNFTLDVAIAPFRSTSVARSVSLLSTGVSDIPAAVATSSTQTCADIAHALSSQLADTAKARYEQQSGNLEVAIWPPDQLDVTRLADEDLLVASKKLATAQQLDLVMVGSVACDANRVIVTPSLVASPALEAALAELPSIHDLNALTSPIVWNSSGNMLSTLLAQLANRLDLAVRFGLSLERYNRGTAGNFVSAATMAESLLPELAQWPADAAAVHVLAGNAYMHATTDDCGAVQPNQLDRAGRELEQALALEPQMANAHLALGALMGYRADALQADLVDQRQNLLEASERSYQRALLSKDVSNPGLMALEVALGRGRNKLIEYDTSHRPELLDAARFILKPAESAVAMPALRARALALRAGIDLAQRNTDAALSAFGQAQSLTQDRALYTNASLAIAQIQTAQGNVCGAAVQYRLASQTLCAADHADFASQAENLQLSCKLENDLRQ